MAKLGARRQLGAGGGGVSQAADEILEQAASAAPRRRRKAAPRARPASLLEATVPIALPIPAPAPDRFHGLLGEAAGARVESAGLEVMPGELLAVLGPAGSGKSRLCSELAGLAPATEGGVWVAGLPLHQLGQADLERFRLQRIGLMVERPAFFESMSALANLEVAGALAGVPAANRAATARKLLDLVGPAPGARLSAAGLDPGRRRLLGLARALARKPGLLLADEPLSGLDPEAAEAVLALIKEANRGGLTVVLFTSDPALAAEATRTVGIRAGRVEPAGAPRRTAHAPAAIDPPGRIDDRAALWLSAHLTISRPGVAAAGLAVQASLAMVLGLALAAAPRRTAPLLAVAALFAMLVAGARLGQADLAARRPLLAALRGLGARARDLRLVLLAEATLKGALAGALGGWAANLPSPHLGLGTVALVTLLSAAAGLASALPATLAARRVTPPGCDL